MVTNAILGAVVASVVWFIIGGGLYMNPWVAKMYKEAERSSPALKKWQSIPKYLGFQFLGILAQCLLWAFIFSFIKPILPDGVLQQAALFWLILAAVKLFPRFVDMWIQTTYPNKLLAVEFINGAIGSFIIALVFAFIV